MTAFDKYFKSPVPFTEGFGDAVSALAYTREEARHIFQEEEIGDHHDYVIPLEEIEKSWVHWHGGIDDDGEMRNGWWIDPNYENKRGAKPVWTYKPDWHLINKGHSYERSPEYWNRCVVCDPPQEATKQGDNT